MHSQSVGMNLGSLEFAFFLGYYPTRHFQQSMKNHLCAHKYIEGMNLLRAHCAEAKPLRANAARRLTSILTHSDSLGSKISFSSTQPEPADLESVGVSLLGFFGCVACLVGARRVCLKTTVPVPSQLVARATGVSNPRPYRPIIIRGDWNAPHATLRAKSLWGLVGLRCLHVVSLSGSKATFRGRTATARWSSH
ncbi:hypothetical protein BASA50_010723 [Batrachochytrium salamandrivorans]|uniref:Uncharacterized protein n=1 Tax=Batrachochytrium salamandrivorans TaxID=1357716 RepID=A0ABQ8EXR1_9FUNG|nr:hypothetical protein BASA50_010723 [Batrachochytrium salamandrivorans]